MAVALLVNFFSLISLLPRHNLRSVRAHILVGETGPKVQVLLQSMGDSAALAEMSQTKDDSVNSFAKGMNDSQRALTAEIDRLRAENKSLKDQVDQMDQTLGLNDNGPDAPKPKLTLPTEQDVDKAFGYLETMAKKIHERVDRLQELQERGPGKALSPGFRS